MSEIPKFYEESALSEPSLSELYGQLAQIMRSPKRRILAWDADAPALDARETTHKILSLRPSKKGETK